MRMWARCDACGLDAPKPHGTMARVIVGKTCATRLGPMTAMPGPKGTSGLTVVTLCGECVRKCVPLVEAVTKQKEKQRARQQHQGGDEAQA